ncbi:MAG: hypothetical protein GXO40_00430 [Epsilonproteobacteria bacterium]|nr:hypothetical protein [Campylobacterota bacterium]
MKPQKKSQIESNTNIQNNLNIHLAPDIFKSITQLDKQNPELAKKRQPKCKRGKNKRRFIK